MSVFDEFHEAFDSEYRDLRASYDYLTRVNNSLRQQLPIVHDQFVDTLNIYRSYVGYNAVLLISAKVIEMADTQFEVYLAITNTPPLSLTPNQRLPPEVVNNLSKSAGGDYILNAIYKLDQVTHNPSLSTAEQAFLPLSAVEDALNGFALSGLNMIPGFTDSVPASLVTALSLPFEITAYIAAVGMEIILLPFNMINSKDQLREAIQQAVQNNNQFSNSINTINSAIFSLEQGKTTEKILFRQIMTKFSSIQPAKFNWQLSDIDGDITYLTTMNQATAQYGIVNTIRVDWQNGHRNNPDLSWGKFVDFEIAKRDSARVTSDEVTQFAELVKQHSESMQQAT